MDAKEISNITWCIRSFPFLRNFMVKLAAKGYHDRLSQDMTEELLNQNSQKKGKKKTLHPFAKTFSLMPFEVVEMQIWLPFLFQLEVLECPALLTRKDTLMVA